MNSAKEAVAFSAAATVANGMRVGLGTGSTMAYVLRALADRIVKDELRFTGVATSRATERQARELGISLEPLDGPCDLTIDGADEIEVPGLRLLKGGGGAMLREKMVAESSRRLVVVADASKLVPCLGSRMAVPVEVEVFGHLATARRIANLGGAPRLRLQAGEPAVTDGGNLILDCPGFGPLRDPFTLERQLRSIAGVLGTGLFLMPVEFALIGHPDGSEELVRP